MAPAPARGEDEESLWGSDWDSDFLWESDWESDSEQMPPVAKQLVNTDYDSENEVLRVKSIKSLTSDDTPGRGMLSREARRSVIRPGRKDVDCLDDDDRESDEDDDTDPESEGGAPGFACHFCKLRNGKRKVHCSRCPITFCGLCLQNRNGEQLEVETQEGVKWVCPKCRAGCGPGCNNCCTCAPCRKSQGLAPAGQVIRVARQVGFDNVHDYLIHRQTGESRDKIADRKKGKGWTKAGAISFRCTEVVVPKLKPAQLWMTTDSGVPANRGAVDLWNQKQGVAWTIPRVLDEIMMSTNNNVKPGDGEPGGAIVPFGEVRNPAHGVNALKSIHDEHKELVDERKEVIGRVLGREAQKRARMNCSLEQIVNRLMHPEDGSGAQRGNVHMKRRNRKHRKLGRILEPSMFNNRKKKCSIATKPGKATPEVPSSERIDNAHSDICAKKQSSLPPAVQSVQHDPPSLKESIPLKRPITSLQALRKMGILVKRNHASFASEEPSPQQMPASASSSVSDHSIQSLKERSRVETTPPPIRPCNSPESGTEAILLRHLERRKKIEFRSCLKSQNAVPAVPTNSTLVKERVEWRGGERPVHRESQSGIGQFSERGFVTGFELSRQNGTPSGFESFSQRQTLIAFGSVNGEKKAGLSGLNS